MPSPESTLPFVKLSRKFFDHPFWTADRMHSYAEAWLDLIATAAFANHTKIIGAQAFDVQRGQIVASVRFLCKRWSWSNTRVLNFLRLLESESMVTREKRHDTTVLTLCNFETYNTSELPKTTEERRNDDGLATVQRRNSDKDKKEKEGINNPPKSPKGGRGGVGGTPTTEEAKRIAAIFNRQPSTKWSVREVKAFKALHPIDPQDIALLESYYRAEKGNPENILRRDLQTLLNNFPGEVDRARGYVGKHQPSRASDAQPDPWKGIERTEWEAFAAREWPVLVLERPHQVEFRGPDVNKDYLREFWEQKQ